LDPASPPFLVLSSISNHPVLLVNPVKRIDVPWPKMPMHNGLLPREGFKADTVMRVLSKTAFNPAFTLPLLLLARFTKKGEEYSILHRKAFSRVKLLFYLGLARWLSGWYSTRVVNNWQEDQYDWRGREIVLITGGSGGIGSHVVRFLSEKGVKVVVLDIQPLTYEARKSTPAPALAPSSGWRKPTADHKKYRPHPC
jgi:hypothetical protein